MEISRQRNLDIFANILLITLQCTAAWTTNLGEKREGGSKKFSFDRTSSLILSKQQTQNKTTLLN